MDEVVATSRLSCIESRKPHELNNVYGRKVIRLKNPIIYIDLRTSKMTTRAKRRRKE